MAFKPLTPEEFAQGTEFGTTGKAVMNTVSAANTFMQNLEKTGMQFTGTRDKLLDTLRTDVYWHARSKGEQGGIERLDAILKDQGLIGAIPKPIKVAPVANSKAGGRKFEDEFDHPEQLRSPAKAPKTALPKSIEEQVKDEIGKLARKLERTTPEWKASYQQHFTEGNVAAEAARLADKENPVSQASRSAAVEWAQNKFVQLRGDSEALLKAIQKINH